MTHLLAVLQDALLGADAALGARGVRLPLAALHVDVHVELPAKHGHLGLRQQAHGDIRRHLSGARGERLMSLQRLAFEKKNEMQPKAPDWSHKERLEVVREDEEKNVKNLFFLISFCWAL